MAKEHDRDSCLLRDLRQRAGNDICADCGAAEPDWVSVTLGVFVCQGCSLIHRSIPCLSQVKSVLQDTFENNETEFIASMGNEAAKANYEQQVPPFYYRPSHTDCRILREQWIRAKYERQEFIHIEKQEPYSAGYREGFLWKRGRDNGQFLSRKFILSEREGALKYFNKQDAREAKAIMRIETLNATFQPAKIGNPCGLQITYLKDNSTRNIFVYHEDSKEMVDWFTAIRAARFHYQKVAFPGANDEDLVPRLTRNFMKEGYMEKTGPRHTEGFKKRWFTMDDRRLMYFKDPLDAFARGEVFIGSKENSYTVGPGLPPSIQGYHWKYGITIETPDRKFLFACETEAEQKDWIAAFQRVVNRPMMPQEYAVEAHFKHKP
ncbi:arf-GAP with dual PH domain-containing protein 1-like isoform X1 [Myxocyprinus asiaticus]|uniref:arf-GAP with dual PH domain-containing protein 1-like isoform X1 n=1 Tax=Myxocyprinus asiaticus TaxID=70543 RepID=UPI002222AD30|nr:arf-GAP with dual PH domain-containing protein 1-like isoform X1 [Myxocyprinus asiaticus]